MKIVMIRHTRVAVPTGVCYGHSDVALADSFPQEAAKVKKNLSNFDIKRAYTSPSSRCRQLADYCGFGDARVDDRLMEINFGEWEMRRYEEIDDPRLQLWYEDYLNVAATGGESSMMQRARLEDFLKSLTEKEREKDGSGEEIGVFTHGGILIHSLVLLKGMSYDEAYRTRPGYGSVIEFNLSEWD